MVTPTFITELFLIAIGFIFLWGFFVFCLNVIGAAVLVVRWVYLKIKNVIV